MPVHILQLTYEQYTHSGRSVAHTIIDKYSVHEKIGVGSFGSVYKGMNDQTKKEIAVKVLDLVSIEGEKSAKVKEIRKRLAKSESQLMMRCDSNNVMKCYDVYENKDLKIMMIEFCNGGTLADQLVKRRIPEKEAIDIIKQLLCGISEMHKKGIIHRDLKAENIMFHNGILKIVDLGFSKAFSQDPEFVDVGTVLGTIITMAPEVMKRRPYGLKADIWSIGIILYEIIYGRLPYEPLKAPQMYDQIMQKDIFPNGGKIGGIKPSEPVLDLMKKILVKEQEYRLTWNQLLEHPAFDEAPELPENYRITKNISKLKHQKVASIHDKTDQQYLEELQFLPTKKSQEQAGTIQVKWITKDEVDKKKKQMDKEEDKILQWVRENYHECLKTEFILKEIVIPIEKRHLLNFNDRKNVELMYLITSRCFLNMSFIQFEIKKTEHDHIQNINQTVYKLYGEVCKKFNHYCQILKKQQDKISEIVKDRFSKMFSSTKMETKEKFMSGIQNTDYDKEEQVKFTYDIYIKRIIEEIKDAKVQKYLNNYILINLVSLEQIQEKTFNEYIKGILKK